jgi:hypothetical protein
MIIDDSYHPHGLLVGLPFLLYKTIPDQIPDRLGTILITLLLKKLIEVPEQRIRNRYAKSGNSWHFLTIRLIITPF